MASTLPHTSARNLTIAHRVLVLRRTTELREDQFFVHGDIHPSAGDSQRCTTMPLPADMTSPAEDTLTRSCTALIHWRRRSSRVLDSTDTPPNTPSPLYTPKALLIHPPTSRLPHFFHVLPLHAAASLNTCHTSIILPHVYDQPGFYLCPGGGVDAIFGSGSSTRAAERRFPAQRCQTRLRFLTVSYRNTTAATAQEAARYGGSHTRVVQRFRSCVVQYFREL